ncbi:MAG TPA: DUF4214 domain-containing protein [Pyrinomonadaceae bacterium]|nr:DUF4214 domain-containing protein [Pyrinomonadaceae bacterium]
MRNTAIALTLLIIFSAGVYAQSPPTLRIVTETPNLPSELYYGDIKVKPLRLRPGTTIPITIDDSDFFVHQHYIDFLSRFAEPQGFQDWMNYLNSEQQRCPTDPECLHQARITASAGFFGSQEFNIKGGYVFRFYKASLGRLPEYQEMVTGMNAVTGQTADETLQKKTQFAIDWVLRPDFLAAFPRSLSPTEFVDNILAAAGVGLANRTQIINDLAANNNDAGRAVAMRAIADSTEVTNKEFNPSFVYMQYVGYLRRKPEPEGYNNWLTYLNANPTDFRTMVRGFMDSTEYRARF